jgi:hypothetical protein
MKRLAYKLSIIVLLSGTYAAAVSGHLTGSGQNPIKDATKTNYVCICPNGDEVICHFPNTCVTCCK